MADLFDKEKRSYVMSRVRSADTKPELVVRSLLHRAGFRFSLRRKDLPGKPDVVMPKYRTVLFVHGCFWHRHEGCPRSTMPATRVEFWQEKFARTVERDAAATAALTAAGWRVFVIWECEVRADPVMAVQRVIDALEPYREDLLQTDRRQLMRDVEARFEAVWRRRGQ